MKEKNRYTYMNWFIHSCQACQEPHRRLDNIKDKNENSNQKNGNGKIAYLSIFELWDGFWTLRGGPLDPLDRYRIPQKNEKIDFLQKYHI